MQLEDLRAFCLSLPHTEEKIQWGDHLLFTIGGKMYCVTTVEPANPTKMSFKCTPDLFAELIENEGVIPAPYMARNFWVALTEWDAVPAAELKQHLRNAHQLVFQKLPKGVQQELGATGEAPGTAPKKRASRKTSGPKKKVQRKPSGAKKHVPAKTVKGKARKSAAR